MKWVPLFIFWCLWFTNFSGRTAFSPILPLIEDSLSLSHGEAGGLFISLSIGYSISLLLVGRFASGWGYKRTVVGGFVGLSLVLVLMQWMNSYAAFHIFFLLMGLALGSYLPSIISIITETYDAKHWGKAIGFHDSAASLSIFAIPILVTYGLHFLSWKRLFLFLAAAALLFPILFWKVSVEPTKKAVQKPPGYLDVFKRKTTRIMGLFWIFSSASCMGVYSILSLYLVKEKGIPFDTANTLIGISRVAGIFVSISVGFLTDRFGYRMVIQWSLLTTGLSTIFLSSVSAMPWIMIALILQAILSLTFFPAGFAAISNVTPLSERAIVTGVINASGIVFGIGVTPFLLGVVADHLSFKVGLLGLGILVTLSSFCVKRLKET